MGYPTLTYFFVALSAFCFGVASTSSSTDKTIGFSVVGILTALGALLAQAIAIHYGFRA
tara:strand:- start:236 stop:412 length:177 start_codon:yes stop_codon:yes gene_type:complete